MSCNLNGINPWNGKATFPQLQKGDHVYRVCGGEARSDGASWTTADPRTIPNYRDAAGLPNVNTGEKIIEAVVLDPSKCVKIRLALPLDGNKGGGVIEYIIPEPYNGGLMKKTEYNLSPHY